MSAKLLPGQSPDRGPCAPRRTLVQTAPQESAPWLTQTSAKRRIRGIGPRRAPRSRHRRGIGGPMTRRTRGRSRGQCSISGSPRRNCPKALPESDSPPWLHVATRPRRCAEGRLPLASASRRLPVPRPFSSGSWRGVWNVRAGGESGRRRARQASAAAAPDAVTFGKVALLSARQTPANAPDRAGDVCGEGALKPLIGEVLIGSQQA